MDSLTQIALGACVTAICVPSSHRRKAIVIGAALGTLPDLDVVINFGDDVANFTMHRGFSHSLFVLTPLALLIWIFLRRWWQPVRQNPRAWLLAIFCALITHPLLDAHTAYGTQLWWPLTPSPTSWATLFIIDPLYTLPLLIAALVVLIRPLADSARRWLIMGIVLSSSYLAWSWVARSLVLHNVRQSLASEGITDAPIFLTPSPFNTLLWRVVVMQRDGYYEGFDSVVADDGPMEFAFYPSDTASLRAASDVAAVARLQWFSNGFVGARLESDQLIITDLRMGQEPDYVFRHAVATRGNPHWHVIEPTRLPSTIRTERLKEVWKRVWRSP